MLMASPGLDPVWTASSPWSLVASGECLFAFVLPASSSFVLSLSVCLSVYPSVSVCLSVCLSPSTPSLSSLFCLPSLPHHLSPHLTPLSPPPPPPPPHLFRFALPHPLSVPPCSPPIFLCLLSYLPPHSPLSLSLVYVHTNSHSFMSTKSSRHSKLDKSLQNQTISSGAIPM